MSRQADAPSWWAWSMPVVIAIVVTVVIPRLLMLNVSVIDWDESIYALIGQQWTEGHVPHETVFDHKPIGLFGIFALFFLALGDTVWAIRLIPIVFVAATAALLARLAQDHFGPDRMLGGVIAALYGLLTLTNGGLATNTEILVNFFVVLSIYLIVAWRLDRRESFPASLLAGASLGMAMHVNYLAGILVVGVAGFYLAWTASLRPVTALLRRYFQNGIYMLSGFLLVAVAVHLPVVLFGDPADYFALKFAYLDDYQGIGDMAVVLRRITEALAPYWPFYGLALLLAVSALPRRRSSEQLLDGRESPTDRRVLAWIVLCLFALAAAVASRRFYHHFFLFSVPALVMLAGAFLRRVCPAGRFRNFCAAWLVLMAGAAALDSHEEFLRGYRSHVRVLHGLPADSIAEAGEFMAKRLRPGESIFVYDGQPILYFMTRTVPPTRFAFPTSYLQDELAGRFGFTPYDAVQAILQREPRFIIARPRPEGPGLTRAAARLYDTLERDYVPVSADHGSAPANVHERTGATAGSSAAAVVPRRAVPGNR